MSKRARRTIDERVNARTAPSLSRARSISMRTPTHSRIEGELIYARWAILVGGMLHLLFSARVVSPIYGWIALAVYGGGNAALAFARTRRPYSAWVSLAAQLLDTAGLLCYTAALQGGMVRYLSLYTSPLILAVMRFGLWGAAGSVALGIVIGGAAIVLSAPTATLSWSTLWSGTARLEWGQLSTTLAALAVDAVLLSYFAVQLQRQNRSHAQDIDHLHKRVSEITVLHQVSSAVHDLSSEDALQNIVEIATKVLGFGQAALFLTDRVAEVIPRTYYSFREPSLDSDRKTIHLAPQLFRAILEQQAPIMIDGSQGSPHVERGPVLQIAVPLHGAQSPLGVLVADSSDRLGKSNSDIEMLNSLAESAVVAIDNANLHYRIKHIANRDGLTELHNHRYFQERLREVLDQSGGRWAVSLMMIEIDQFKRYNDTFGHRQGDMALYSLARALERATRPWEGLVARYGGDEFVVILPRVSVQQAIWITHRLRDEVYLTIADLLSRHNLPPVRLSIGVATFPGDARTAGELIDAADQAMYVVKRQGGDWMHVYSEPRITAP